MRGFEKQVDCVVIGLSSNLSMQNKQINQKGTFSLKRNAADRESVYHIAQNLRWRH